MDIRRTLIIIALAAVMLTAGAYAAYDPNHFDPDNAAHWYRKAFALYEEPNDIDLLDFAKGKIELTPGIKQFLEKQQPVIDLVMKATHIEKCDWQFDRLASGVYSVSPYLGDFRQITFLFAANIRYKQITSQDEDIKSLFSPLLQISRHADSPDFIDHFTTLTIRSIAYDSMYHYLEHCSDFQLIDLYRIKDLIHKESNYRTLTCKDVLTENIQHAKIVLMDSKKYIYDDPYWTETWGLPTKQLSEDFYKRNFVQYKEYMLNRQNCLDLPYLQAIKKIEIITEDFRENIRKQLPELKDITNNLEYGHKQFFIRIASERIEQCDLIYTLISTGDFISIVSYETRIQTKLNALEAGIQLLIRYRSLHNLPEKLSFNSPKDLFTDKPFELVTTENGFKLVSKGSDYTGDKKELYEYEFVLPED